MVDHSLTATDVGITSPDSTHAGRDCVISMFERTNAFYAPYINTLENNGLTYKPAVWSAYGRPHDQATAIIASIANTVARRSGSLDANSIRKRVMQAIATEIWRRNAHMLQRCMSYHEEES